MEAWYVRAVEVHNGQCDSGHPFPEFLRKSGNGYYCGECRKRTPKLCRRGLHTMPRREPGDVSRRLCEPCKRASQMIGPRVQSAPLPPDAVIEGAACSPSTASLFDLGDSDKPSAGTGKALTICAGCPVRALCRDDAVRHSRVGVYGGVIMTKKWHKDRRIAQVQYTGVQSCA